MIARLTIATTRVTNRFGGRVRSTLTGLRQYNAERRQIARQRRQLEQLRRAVPEQFHHDIGITDVRREFREPSQTQRLRR